MSGEGIYDSLPEDLVKSVLEQSGFKDTLEPEPAPTPEPDDGPGLEEEPPVEPEEPATAPEAPGGPLFTEEPDETPEGSVRLPDGRLLPLALVQEWADAQSRPQPPVATPSTPLPVTPPPTSPAAPPFVLPRITEEDLEAAGPVGQALLMIANEQAKQLAQVREQAQLARQATEAYQRRENAEIANSAASAFQSQFSLPDDLMTKVKESTSWHDIQAYLDIDPDPYKATQHALTKAYWNTPEARQYEFERQAANRTAAESRKRKLAGISGSGGSGPRGTPPVDESTEEGRKAAAVEFVRAAMYGDNQ